MVSRDDRDPTRAFEARHAAIIARTLGWADEAAARHDYVAAVRWVETIRGLGGELPHEFEVKREAWLRAIGPVPRDQRA